MKRVLCCALAILLVLSASAAFAAPVESTHLSKAIGDGFFFEGDIVAPEKSEYATYEIRYPDLTTRDPSELHSIGDLLFRDRESERIFDDGREADQSGLINIFNSSREYITIYQYGGLYYHYVPSINRYDPFLFRITSTGQTETGDLPFMSRAEADLAVREMAAATGVASSFELTLRDGFSIDHALLRTIYEQQKAKGAISAEIIEQTGILSADDWTEADDTYVFNYGFTLDGLPILADYRNRQLRVPTTVSDLWGLPLMASGKINSAGIFSLEVQTADVVRENEARPILSWEDALSALESKLSQLIPPARMEIAGGFVCYVPIAYRNDQLHCELTPVWVFPCFATSEGRQFTDDAFLFNAFTGEELS